MTTIIVKTEADKADMIRVLKNRKPPFTMSITKGVKRTNEQNRLQRKWLSEAAEQGDHTAEEYRAYCKLHIGVPILRLENDFFRERYDEIIKPLPYETKLAMMAEPFDFPVTRLMSTKQKKHYLDAMYIHFRGLGFILTDPDNIPIEVYA